MWENNPGKAWYLANEKMATGGDLKKVSILARDGADLSKTSGKKGIRSDFYSIFFF